MSNTETGLMDKVKIEFKERDEVISANNLDKSMFLEAGAGAGKTRAIVHRILCQLRTGNKLPGEIVVITFTNKAAEELRGRITVELSKAIGSAEDDELINLKNALNHMDDMNVSTIHSFCYSLLKEKCFDAGLPADVALMDQEAYERDITDAFDKWMEAFEKADWDQFTDIKPDSSRFKIRRDLFDIYKKICPLQSDVNVVNGRKDGMMDENTCRATIIKLGKEMEDKLVCFINLIDPAAGVSSFKDIVLYEEQTVGCDILGECFDNVKAEVLNEPLNPMHLLISITTGELGKIPTFRSDRNMFTNPLKADAKSFNMDEDAMKDVQSDVIDYILSIKDDALIQYEAAKGKKGTDEAKKACKDYVDSFNSKFGELVSPLWTGYKLSALTDALDKTILPEYLNYFTASILGLAEKLNDSERDNVKLLKKIIDMSESTASYFKKTPKSDAESYRYDAATFNAATLPVKVWIDNNKQVIERIFINTEVRYQDALLNKALEARANYVSSHSVNTLSNDELLEKTKKLILEHDDVQEYFAGKYKCYYVDEFQDTDSIQEAFIWRLASEPKDSTKLRDGALFIVGDPKQSIYRFRGAQPNVYLGVKKRMEEMQAKGDKVRVYNFNINFRSNNLIIEWVNEKFGDDSGLLPIMAPTFDDIIALRSDSNHVQSNMYHYQDMIPLKAMPDEIKNEQDHWAIPITDDRKILAGVYKLNKAESEKKKTSKKGETEEAKPEENKGTENNNVKKIIKTEPVITTEEECQALTDLIINLKENYLIVDYKDGGKDGSIPYTRKINNKDFMILCSGVRKMNTYMDYLSAHGIDIQIAGSTMPSKFVEFNAFVRIYDYIANRKDRMAREAALESIRLLNDWWGNDEVDQYGRWIMDTLYDETFGMSPFGKAKYLLNRVSALFSKSDSTSAFQIQSILAKIEQMIETVCSEDHGTAKDVSKKFKEYLNIEVAHELSFKDQNAEEIIEDEQGNNNAVSGGAVQFMNVHKSKGLEGNIVIIMDRRKGNKPGNSCRIDDIYYPYIDFLGDVKEYEKKETLADRRRLEYVAATRAAKALIFMDQMGSPCLFGKVDQKNGVTNETYGLLELNSINMIISEKENGIVPPGNTSYNLEDEDKRIQNKQLVNEEPLKKSLQSVSPSSFEDTSGDIKAEYRERAKAEGKTYASEQSVSLPRPVGNVFGDALHMTMENIVNRYTVINKANDELKDKLIKACVNKAVSDKAVDIAGYISKENKETGIAEEKRKYQAFLLACARVYYKYLQDTGLLSKDVEQVLTELPFSYYEDIDEAVSGQVKRANIYLKEKKKLDDISVWMNGAADLIIVYKDRIEIIDYKSDNDYLIYEEDFHEYLKKKYAGQLDNYKYAMSKLFNMPEEKISMRIISFSQKDLSGNILPGHEVRVRETIMN